MVDSLINEFSINVSRDEFLKRQDEKRLVVFNKESMVSVSGTIELIQYLYDNGLKLGLASSSPRYFIEMVLNNFDLLKYFTIIVSGEELERSKPHPDIYLKAAEQIGISPIDCVAIEDANAGVRSAKAAGMYTIGYQNPNSGAQDLSAADVVIQDMKEVCKLFKF
jgi:HAD superfamily hydrolase (TIGR01509 family)